MMKSKQATYRSQTVIPLFLGLALACGSKKKAPTDFPYGYDPSTPVTLTFSSSYGTNVNAGWTTTVTSAAFAKAFPNVTISWQDSGGDEANRIPTCAQQNTCYDIESMPKEVVQAAAAQGSLVDLSKAPYSLSLTGVVDYEKIYNVGAAGQLWALPIDVGPYFTGYRIDLVTAALQQYNTDHPSQAVDASSESAVMAYMDQLTWDDFLDQLAPYLFSPGASATNGGFPMYPLLQISDLAYTSFDDVAPGFLDANLNFTPDAVAMMRKTTEIVRRLILGQNDGSVPPPVAGYDPSLTYVAGFTAPLYKTADPSTVPCNITFDSSASTDYTTYLDVSLQGDVYADCLMESGYPAVHLVPAWGRGFYLTTLAPGQGGAPTPASPRDTYAWSAGKFKATRLFGFKAGGILSADIPHLLSEEGGTNFAVTTTSKYPRLAAAIVEYMTGQVSTEAQITSTAGSFPTLIAAWSDPLVTAADPGFNQSLTPIFSATVTDISTQVSGRKPTSYDGALLGAFQSILGDIDLSTDLSDAGASALQDSVVSQMNAQLATLKSTPARSH
jgi:hypothetical protein